MNMATIDTGETTPRSAEARPGPAGALAGTVALVTGAGSGLGAALCTELAGCGAAVVAADIRSDAAALTVQRLHEAGADAIWTALDVADDGQALAACRAAIRRFGRLDVLVNCAGIDRTVAIEELEPEAWDRILGTNLTGPFIMSRRALVIMREQGGGHIVNVISTAAKRAWANAAAYHASKWGLLGFSHALHVEARACNVKVTAVVAGGMRTPFLLDRFPDIDLETLQDPADVARTIRGVLTMPAGAYIPEIMVLPRKETSWP